MVQSRCAEGPPRRDPASPRGRRDDVRGRNRHRPARSPGLDDGALKDPVQDSLGCRGVLSKKRLLAKVLPEPDLKYRSSLRAVTSSATATYERRTAGKYWFVETTSPR